MSYTNMTHATGEPNVRERRCLVTYKRDTDGEVVILEGRGLTKGDALADADAQLRPGTWTRLLVSSAATIYQDVSGSTRNKKVAQRQQDRTKDGEGGIVTVPEYEV